jgi:hypothetical protein
VLFFVPTVSHAFFSSVLQVTSLVGIDQLLIGLGQVQMRLR